jgi:hypothetical protein
VGGRQSPCLGSGLVRDTFVITKNVKEQFAIFGASGAFVFALITWFVLTYLFRPDEPEQQAS